MLVSSQHVFVCLWLFVLVSMNINCDCLYCDRVCFKNYLSLCCCRFPRCEGHFHRQETNVTHVRSEFTWWSGCVQRDSTSTGSVSAVPRVAVPCGRDRTPSTPSTVCVVKQQHRTYMWLLSDINATAFTSQVNCTVSFTLIDWKTAQTCTGTCPFVRWVLFLKIPAALKQLLLLNITFPPPVCSESARYCSWGADCRWGSEFRGQQLGWSAEPVLSRYLRQVHKDPPELAPECDWCRVRRPPPSLPQHVQRSAGS